MTVTELVADLSRFPGTHEVCVAGHGALHFVTHGGSEDGRKVVTLYVTEPEPEPVEEFTLTSEV